MLTKKKPEMYQGAGDGLLHLFAEIQRVDEEKQEVIGYAYVNPVVDGEGGICLSRAAMEQATPDYMKWGAIREMHRMQAAGTAVEVQWDETGALLRAKIVDPLAWQKVKERVYRGFSITARPVIMRGKEVTECKWIETSLVDRPKDQGAVFTMYRAEGEGAVEGLPGSDESDASASDISQSDPATPSEERAEGEPETPAETAAGEQPAEEQRADDAAVETPVEPVMCVHLNPAPAVLARGATYRWDGENLSLVMPPLGDETDRGDLTQRAIESFKETLGGIVLRAETPAEAASVAALEDLSEHLAEVLSVSRAATSETVPSRENLEGRVRALTHYGCTDDGDFCHGHTTRGGAQECADRQGKDKDRQIRYLENALTQMKTRRADDAADALMRAEPAGEEFIESADTLTRALEGEHDARQRDPALFTDDSFRRKEVAPGVALIMGQLKEGAGEGQSVQAVRFAKSKFTPEQARGWLVEHQFQDDLDAARVERAAAVAEPEAPAAATAELADPTAQPEPPAEPAEADLPEEQRAEKKPGHFATINGKVIFIPDDKESGEPSDIKDRLKKARDDHEEAHKELKSAHDEGKVDKETYNKHASKAEDLQGRHKSHVDTLDGGGKVPSSHANSTLEGLKQHAQDMRQAAKAVKSGGETEATQSSFSITQDGNDWVLAKVKKDGEKSVIGRFPSREAAEGRREKLAARQHSRVEGDPQDMEGLILRVLDGETPDEDVLLALNTLLTRAEAAETRLAEEHEALERVETQLASAIERVETLEAMPEPKRPAPIRFLAGLDREFMQRASEAGVDTDKLRQLEREAADIARAAEGATSEDERFNAAMKLMTIQTQIRELTS